VLYRFLVLLLPPVACPVRPTQDGIYDNGGTLLRPDGGTSARCIGTQLDATITYTSHRMSDVTFSYSTFFPGRSSTRRAGPRRSTSGRSEAGSSSDCGISWTSARLGGSREVTCWCMKIDIFIHYGSPGKAVMHPRTSAGDWTGSSSYLQQFSDAVGTLFHTGPVG